MRLSVRFLLSLIVASALILALTCMGLILNAQIKSHLLNAKKTELTRVANDLARLAARDYDPGADRARMDAWAKEMGELGNYRISLIDENGRLYGDSLVPNIELDGADNHGRRPEVAEALAFGQGQSLRHSTTIGQDYLYAAGRIDYSGSPRVLRVGTSIDALNETRHDLLKSYALVAGLGLALALGAVWIGSRKLAQSFQDVVTAAGAMAGGDLARRAGTGAPGELGQVARAINHLAESLSLQLAQTEKGLNQLLAVLEAMSDGVLVADDDGRIIRVNQRAEDMLSLTAEDKRLIAGLRYPELADDFDQTRSGRNAPPRLLHQVGPPERFIEARFSRVGGQAGEMVAVFHDLTERQKLYQMRRDFVANISHELRTPLTAIMGVVENLRARPELSELGPLMGILERQTTRLHELARDVLELAKLERQAESIELQEVNVKDIFAEVLTRHPEERFSLIIPEDMPFFAADRPALTGAVDNLADNALKYGRPDGSVTLEAGFNENDVWIRVKNEGPAIAPEDRPRVFERFYRGEKSRRQGPGGTGLGLAIVKHVALSHQGSAGLECPDAGGVVFSIKLPRRPEKNA